MIALRHFGGRTGELHDIKLACLDSPISPLPSRQHRLLLTRLAAVTDIHEPEFLERMIRLGIHPVNAEAFRYLPIAVVAWGSGSVTARERVLALSPVFSTELFTSRESVSLFKSWLQIRPHANLMAAWEDFVDLRLRTESGDDELSFGQNLLQQATRVALASGGLLDQGDICAGERIVLNRIARAYGIDNS